MLLRHAEPRLPQLPDSLHRLAINIYVDHPISYLDTLITETGSKIIEVTIHRRCIIIVAVVVKRM